MQPMGRAGWRSTCNRPASDRSSGQSSPCTAPSAPVAASLAGQLVPAVQSPCFRDARYAQREAESTHPFHIIRHPTAISPCRSRVFPTQLASGAALRPATEGKIKGDGTSRSESIEKSTRHSGAQISLRAAFFRKARKLKDRSGTVPLNSPPVLRMRVAARVSVIPLAGASVHDPEHADSRSGYRWP
jgi:hypothetical protein